MTAAELAQRHTAVTALWERDNPDGRGVRVAFVNEVIAAINEALELAAQEAENIGRLAVAGDTGREAARFAAERIRRLKPAGPVQPTDTNAAPVDQRRTE